MENKRICSACNISRNVNQFISKAGRTDLSTCQRCRDLKHPKCPHGTRWARCVTCQMNRKCYHGISNMKCSNCFLGAEICIHQVRRLHCKLCDAKEVTIKTMLKDSKQVDVKNNKFDADRFIDKCFIEALMEESMKCYYCKCDMQIVEHNNTLCTIERRDNSIGHIKSNCILACFHCNCSRIGQRDNAIVQDKKKCKCCNTMITKKSWNTHLKSKKHIKNNLTK